MLRVGLTGGIACGKSTVAAILRESGCHVIEADSLAHRLMEPGTPAFEEIVFEFGKQVVGEDGRLQGAVSLHDIKHALEDPEQLGAVVAHDLMVPVGDRLKTTDRLHQAAELFARSDFERLPVCDPAGRFFGVLAKRDLLAIYAQEVLGRPAMLATFVQSDDGARNYVELPPDFTVRMVSLPPALAHAMPKKAITAPKSTSRSAPS